jgi:hypothetical protein
MPLLSPVGAYFVPGTAVFGVGAFSVGVGVGGVFSLSLGVELPLVGRPLIEGGGEVIEEWDP